MEMDFSAKSNIFGRLDSRDKQYILLVSGYLYRHTPTKGGQIYFNLSCVFLLPYSLGSHHLVDMLKTESNQTPN